MVDIICVLSYVDVRETSGICEFTLISIISFCFVILIKGVSEMLDCVCLDVVDTFYTHEYILADYEEVVKMNTGMVMSLMTDGKIRPKNLMFTREHNEGLSYKPLKSSTCAPTKEQIARLTLAGQGYPMTLHFRDDCDYVYNCDFGMVYMTGGTILELPFMNDRHRLKWGKNLLKQDKRRRRVFYFPEGTTKFMFDSFSSLSQVKLVGHTSFAGRQFTGFADCYGIVAVDLSDFTTNDVVATDEAFYNCRALRFVDLSGVTATNVKSMRRMFRGCTSLEEVNLSSFELNECVRISGMFDGCTALKTVWVSAKSYDIWLNVLWSEADRDFIRNKLRVKGS